LNSKNEFGDIVSAPSILTTGYDKDVGAAAADLEFAATNITADVVNNRLQNFLRLTFPAVTSLSGLLEFIPSSFSVLIGAQDSHPRLGNRYAVQAGDLSSENESFTSQISPSSDDPKSSEQHWEISPSEMSKSSQSAR